MDARRARILGGSAVLMGILAATWAGPVAAACALSAPDYVNVGTPLTIEGSGFPASTAVDINLTIEGGASDAFTLQSDANGELQVALTPEEIDIGVTTVQATTGSACTAQVTYTVLAAGETPPPAAPEAEDAGTGVESGAPQTDADPSDGIAGRSSAAPWILALSLLAAGGAGLFMTRSTRRR